MSGKVFLFLVFLSSAIFGYNPNDIKVLHSDAASIVLEYTPIITDSSLFSIEGRDFLRLAIYNGISRNTKRGFPGIQSRAVKLGLPESNGNKVTIISLEKKAIKNMPAPVLFLDKESRLFVPFFDENSYASTQEQPLAELINIGNLRDLITGDLVINPIQYNHSLRELTLYTKVIIKIDYAGSSGRLNATRDDILETLILNYPVAKNWVTRNKFRANKVKNTGSVLSSGKWYRFPVTDEGIYKITRGQLSQFGIDAATVNPRKIQIYSNGGKVVSESLSSPRIDDLQEISIRIIGEEDNTFDEADYILFYGRGVNFFEYDSSNGRVVRRSNPYSNENYYWITAGQADGKRMTNVTSASSADEAVNKTQSFVYWDEDKINIGKTGRIFLGDQFQESFKSRTYTKKLEGLIPDSRINYSYRFVNSSSPSVILQVYETDTLLFSRNIGGYGSNNYSYGTPDIASTSAVRYLNDERSQLKFTFNANNASTIGYLDYFEISYERYLKAVNDQLAIFTPVSGSARNYSYTVNDFSNTDIHFFDVSDHSNVKKIIPSETPSGGTFNFIYPGRGGFSSKIYGVCNTKMLSVSSPIEVPNQNLRGEMQGGEFVIITPKEFRTQAERLANYRTNESKAKIKSYVVNIDEIFNEFSGGLKDPTAIRDYLRHAYLNWSESLSYVLLFGDGDYDYRNIERGNSNWVIPYETNESLDEIFSYATDDFYGRIVGVSGGVNDQLVDLAIGRITAQSINEARIAVDKIIEYENSSDKNLWRNSITLVADDGYVSTGFEGDLHTRQSETLARFYIPGSFDVKKVYAAVYPTVFTSLGRRKPSLNQAIIDLVNSGTLILNYIGHGSPELWAHEQIFIKDVTVPQFRNKDYFFLTAATCDFAYFDKTSGKSSAEEILLKEKAGAIGIFSSVRPVYSFSNAELTYKLFSQMLFSSRDSLNLPVPVGIAYMNAKTTGNLDIDNDSKFFLLADPTLRLVMPQYNASIDTINGSTGTAQVQVRALSDLRISGTIRDEQNNIWTGFDGEGLLTVYDSERNLPVSEFGANYSVSIQGGIIFKGRVSVNNGRFDASIKVPKDISYENKRGKITFYFQNDDGDGIAYADNIVVGGSDTLAVNDNDGPEISIFFDSKKSEYAELINPNSLLIVELKDETGINTTGLGVGHKLEGVLNDDELNSIDLSEYYVGDIDSGGKTGEVRYRFSNLNSGEYKIKIKVWDVYNNPSEKISFFTVVSGDILEVKNVWNYPNPFSSGTTFLLDHNEGEPVDVSIKIYTIAGRLVNELSGKNLAEKYIKIDWDGRDKDGSLLANGTYLYKLTVSKTGDNRKKSVTGKLSVIR
ncbi:MAG: type IX secretion system sortase PorU [Ignavibacteriaceae bacterium]|nr:type IX secretion system sortase PorU [Ignavibacteriaceae bacterium]